MGSRSVWSKMELNGLRAVMRRRKRRRMTTTTTLILILTNVHEFHLQLVLFLLLLALCDPSISVDVMSHPMGLQLGMSIRIHVSPVACPPFLADLSMQTCSVITTYYLHHGECPQTSILRQIHDHTTIPASDHSPNTLNLALRGSRTCGVRSSTLAKTLRNCRTTIEIHSCRSNLRRRR
jgi:hypothetical protein